MKQQRNKATGFTLIELLVVITIIVILSAIGMVSYRSASRSARNSRRTADMHTVRQALVLYRSDRGCYPSGGTFQLMLNTLLADEYLTQPLPVDPKSDGTYLYEYDPISVGSCSPTTPGDGTATGFTLTWQNETSLGPDQQTLTNP